MKKEDYASQAMFEQQFWLQIMGDHARFILQTLAPKEEQEVDRAAYFVKNFDQLLEVSHTLLDRSQLHQLIEQSVYLVGQIKDFKLHLLQRHLVEKISIGLSPTFINHMLNELEEYQRILVYLQRNEVPPNFHPIHHHLVWLQDAIGHAATIESTIDEVEAFILEKGKHYKKHFTDLYLKAVEMAGYLRTNLNQFPALTRLNQQVELEMLLFKEFLDEIKETRLSAEVLGILSPLMADHMAREECYYLTKLSTVSNVKPPSCDPTHHRVEE